MPFLLRINVEKWSKRLATSTSVKRALAQGRDLFTSLQSSHVDRRDTSLPLLQSSSEKAPSTSLRRDDRQDPRGAFGHLERQEPEGGIHTESKGKDKCFVES